MYASFELKRFVVMIIINLQLAPPPIIFEPICAHARWALMYRFLSVRPSVCD